MSEQRPEEGQESISRRETASETSADADFYLEDGLTVFTAFFHRKRGHCCKSGCRHCPWNYQKPALPL